MTLSGALASLFVFALMQGAAAGETQSAKILNVRDFGALGDGHEHSVREWFRSGRYASMRALRRQAPPVADELWSVDEAAFELAKLALPPEGGTIYFPAGTYVATARAWTIGRDHLRILGDGAAQTILATGPAVLDGLVLAGYRHVGWSRGYPIAADDGAQGTDVLRLKEPEAASLFRPGQLVFVRNGANKFDQDYGEFNEVRSFTAEGQIQLRLPLARDYTLNALNWAGKTAGDFRLPPVGDAVRVALVKAADCAVPTRGDLVSVGDAILRVESVAEPSIVHLVNVGRANVAGAQLPAGTLVAKERGVVLLNETTRGFRCEKLTLRGRRKALILSNSYDCTFSDCVIERAPGEVGIAGGVAIDGDDGRFARFQRCLIRADPPWGMQFARSFGGVAFEDCRFVNTNVAFTEFNFDCTVTDCTFDLVGGPSLQSALIVGKSCDHLRMVRNTIKARDLAVVFDAQTDIQSFKVRGRGEVVIRDNLIDVERVKRIYQLDRTVPASVAGNTVRGRFELMGDEGNDARPMADNSSRR